MAATMAYSQVALMAECSAGLMVEMMAERMVCELVE